MSGDGRPLLSVVIAATDSPVAIDRALRALEGQADRRIEVIVVGTSATLGSEIPTGDDRLATRRILAPGGSAVPGLRGIGLDAARGRIVAFTEDSCEVRPGWADAWLSAFEDPALEAASGAVEHADGARILDWAVVFCEYAPFLPPTPSSAPSRLAGNNFALLRESAPLSPDGDVREVDLLAVIVSGGGNVRMVEAAAVEHVRRFGWREAFFDRLRFGLEYGRLRAPGLSPVGRSAALLAGPAIFAIQVIRLGMTILPRRRYRRRFFQALPITLVLLASWSLGEWAGWCLGALRIGLSGADDVEERAEPPGRLLAGTTRHDPVVGPGQ